MALQKRTISLDVGGGQMEGQDKWLAENPVHLRVENGRFDARGNIAKRFGYNALPTLGLPLISRGDPSTVLDAEGQIVQMGPNGSYALDDPTNRWREVSVAAPRVSRVLTDAIVRQNHNVRCVNIAAIGDTICTVWEAFYSETDSDCWYEFRDANTLQVLSGPHQFTSFERAPKVVATGTHFFVFGKVGTSTYGTVYQASLSSYTFAAPILITSNPFYEPIPFGNECMLMHEAVGVTSFRLLDTALATVWVQVTAQGFAGRAICHNVISSSFWAVSAAGDVCECIDDGLSAPTITATLFTVPADLAVSRATICQADENGGMIVLLSGRGYIYNITATGDTEHGTLYGYMTTAPAKTVEGTLPTVVLAGHAKYLGSGVSYVPDIVVPVVMQCRNIGNKWNGVTAGSIDVVNNGLIEPIGYVLRSGGTNTELGFAEAGRFGVDKIDKTNDISDGYGSGETPTFTLNSFNLSQIVDLPKAYMAFGYTVRIENTEIFSTPTSFKGRRGGDIARFRFNYEVARSCNAQNLRLVACGHGLSILDASRHVEANPMNPPMISSDGYDDNLPASVTDSVVGGWNIKLVHRWRDSKGNVYRSAPSPSLHILNNTTMVKVTGGTLTEPVRIVFDTPYPTGLTDDRNLIHDVEVYQTHELYTLGGSQDVYYLADVVQPIKGNSGTANPALTHPNTMSYICVGGESKDAGVLAGLDTRHYAQIIQTPSGTFPAAYFNTELPPGQLPPLLDCVSTQSRLWALPAEGRFSLRATSPLLPSAGPTWPAELEYPIPAEGGECVGLAALDDKVIVFKQRRVYVVFGEPADATGANDGVQTPRLISSDVGCSDVTSIVEGPFGVAFYSERGFYLLSRGLEFSFIGEAVKDTAKSRKVTSAVLVPEHSEVRWTLDSNLVGGHTGTNIALVWNYRLNTWSYWTSYDALAACLWQGKHVRLSAGGYSYQETNDWTNATFNLRVDTSWVKLAGIQGYQRIWAINMLLRYYTGHIRIFMAYDYDETFVENVRWLESELTALMAAAGNRVQLIKKPLKPKGESFQLSIREVATAEGQEEVTAGQGFEWVRMDLEFGVRRGNMKQIGTGGRK